MLLAESKDHIKDSKGIIEDFKSLNWEYLQAIRITKPLFRLRESIRKPDG